MARHASPRDCARALWILGLEPPVSGAQLQAAYRARVARAHPDLHADSEARSEAANVLTRALNAARDLVAEWITAGRDWPVQAAAGAGTSAPPPRGPDPAAAPVCRRTGLRPGDLVRVWPYDGAPEVVAGTEVDGPRSPAWVILRDGGAGLPANRPPPRRSRPGLAVRRPSRGRGGDRGRRPARPGVGDP
ncbi:MAG TPA: hypothetical protein VE777_09605, partial [Gaiellales bacterium]|nr:hypothetical protein [Gaiellales bacterium]